MAATKRKATEKADPPSGTLPKRPKKSNEANTSSSRPSRSSLAAASAPRSTRSSSGTVAITKKSHSKTEKSVKEESAVKEKTLTEKTTPKTKTAKTKEKSWIKDKAATKKRTPKPKAAEPPAKQASAKQKDKSGDKSQKSTRSRKEAAEPTSAGADDANNSKGVDDNQTKSPKARISIDVPMAKQLKSNRADAGDDENAEEEDGDGRSYWLMKAEPDSRLEKGKDVKFSIDDLKVASEPEGWDGVRNPVARNNMRLMMKGDLAFFYHSNTKVPGIVGTMEIVQEHSVDETAFDPAHPYHDPKSTRENPKWCLVHVAFRQKFPSIVKLKDLQKYAKDGGVLENMQVLRQSRLSVSKVSRKEWEFIMGLVEVDDDGGDGVVPEGGKVATADS